MMKVFPLGVFRDRSNEIQPRKFEKHHPNREEIKQQLGLTELQDKVYPQTQPQQQYKNPAIKAA